MHVFFPPIGIVGETEKDSENVYLWTHKKFDIGYNKNSIVDVNLTSEAKVKLEPKVQIGFTYEVSERFYSYFFRIVVTLT